jgi:DNA invertase Pin-like site-specific DNA recombinase
MEHEIKRERVVDSINKRRQAGKDLGGRPRLITDSQIRNARRLIDGGEPVTTVARDLGMSRATFYRRTRAIDLAGESSEASERVPYSPPSPGIFSDGSYGTIALSAPQGTE